MTAQEHEWIKTPAGDVDLEAWREDDKHHGPKCKACKIPLCAECHPFWENLDNCPGYPLGIH